MKISYQWLLDYVDLDVVGLDIHSLAEALTLVGLAVELIEEQGNDYLLDIDVTTNRPDCLNHLGVAREIAARYRLKLKKPDFGPPEGDEGSFAEFPAEVIIEDAVLCPRYAGRVVTDLVISESPDWLKHRLESVGQRPINNIVDITNYVLFAVGHPLHAFDYQKLSGREVRIRKALEGERIRTLDGVERKLDGQMLAICDAEQPVALAGVMGGAESEISESTNTLFLESAYFEPSSVRRTSKLLGLSTEASYRFERGADPGLPVKALNLACRLIEEVGGGRCVSPVIDVFPQPLVPRKIRLREERVNRVLGVSVPLDDSVDILQNLDFVVSRQDSGVCEVEVPSFRGDVELEDDVVEEVARHYGYDRIPSHFPSPAGVGKYPETEYHDRRLLDTLVRFGFQEAINYSFTTPAREEAVLGTARPMIEIGNPLSEMGTHLRTTLIPGLIESVRYNLNRGNSDVRLYEIGSGYRPADEAAAVSEPRLMALAATGDFYSPFWTRSPDPVRFLHIKGLLEALFASVGSPLAMTKVTDVPYLHPGYAAKLMVGDAQIGCFGELHPALVEKFKFSEPVYIAEFSLDTIYGTELSEPCHVGLEKFPSVERDLSFLIDMGVEFSKIRLAVQALGIIELREFRLIDLYQGQNLPEDKVSMTVRLRFADPSRTLTQHEVSERSERIFSVLKAEFEAQPR